MPTYEMPLLLRTMTRPETVSTLKRISSIIFSKGGFIRKIDNLGKQPMPFKSRSHGHVCKEANYFILHFDVPPTSVEDIMEEYGRDIDIIRNRIFSRDEEIPPACTLHEEMLPPAYRPSVQAMVESAKRQEKTKYNFKANSGLDYYPFQK